MKILFINASPRPAGSTARAIEHMEAAVKGEGLTHERIWLGREATLSCLGCGQCKHTGACFYPDIVNTVAKKARECDGFVFATPVHYAGATGMLKAVMGRLFYSAKDTFRQKPAVAVAVGRRGGNVSALSEIEKFFTFNEMPIVSGNYWCILHGTTPDEVDRDLEGVQTATIAAKNLAYLVKCIDIARQNGFSPPPAVEKIRTNYIL